MPVFGAKFVAKISNWCELQSGENIKEFVRENEIDSFEKLDAYLERWERMNSFLHKGDKMDPKAWRREIKELQNELDEMHPEMAETAVGLVYAEVIDYNRHNLKRELDNESRSRDLDELREMDLELNEPPKKHKTRNEPSL